MNSLQSTIYSDGTAVSSNVLSMDIITAINKIPYAQVVISQGGAKNKTPVELSDMTCFKPGQEIELVLSDTTGTMSFKGIVIKQNLKKKANNTYLTVDIKDKAHKLSLLRQSSVFANKDDQTIITDVAKRADVTVDCSATTLTHKQMVQYYCTNWDFIISRAEANGLLVCVENGTLVLKKPDLGDSTTTLSNIHDFEIEADLSSQYDTVSGFCWDMKEAKTIVAEDTKGTITVKGKQDFSQLAKAMSTSKCVLVSGIPAEKEEMTAWANAGLIKNRYSFIRGRISIDGNASLKLGDMVTISEAGTLFGATAIVSGIRHRIDKEGWTTDIQCGLSSKWFYKNEDLIEKPAAGLLPGINGLQIGVVQAYPSDGDPDKIYRVKVWIPAFDELDANQSIIWARLNQPYAGDQRGMFWIPETGDEVVVGFFNDDPRYAVVLGSLYNGQTTPPMKFTENNYEKGMVSKSGISMLFNDEDNKEKLSFTTPGGNQVLLEDENGITVTDKNANKITLHDKGMTVADKNNNTITMDDKGAVIEDTNANKLTLSKQGIEIKDANGNTITLSSAGVEIKDMSGNKEALEASGITVQSSANVTVKGAMINLN
ncbi:MAG TPA: hypothetical protein DDW50_14825 [Firmicutes bacterium]|jgi:Rhs element Vgr protein|nr:hypothetical protein [Bacillota bacterium]